MLAAMQVDVVHPGRRHIATHRHAPDLAPTQDAGQYVANAAEAPTRRLLGQRRLDLSAGDVLEK
jgi:hypothetical protein